MGRARRIENGRTSDDDIVVRVRLRRDLRVDRDRRAYVFGPSLGV